MSQRTIQLVGILNVTPDSFSDGGRYRTVSAAVRHGLTMIQAGASVIDIGGESSRPGAEPVSLAEELRRVIPVITALRKKTTIPISIDTYKPTVAALALAAGATWVNDITGLRNPEMQSIVAQAHCPVIIMHMQGAPRTMQHRPYYRHVIQDIDHFFSQQITAAVRAGIHRSQIILDPGLGFGKTITHNLTILTQLEKFKHFRLPILIGASRKSMIEKITDAATEQRLPGTLALHWTAVQHGATLLRVHDVSEHAQFLTMMRAVDSAR